MADEAAAGKTRRGDVRTTPTLSRCHHRDSTTLGQRAKREVAPHNMGQHPPCVETQAKPEKLAQLRADPEAAPKRRSSFIQRAFTDAAGGDSIKGNFANTLKRDVETALVPQQRLATRKERKSRARKAKSENERRRWSRTGEESIETSQFYFGASTTATYPNLKNKKPLPRS